MDYIIIDALKQTANKYFHLKIYEVIWTYWSWRILSWQPYDDDTFFPS